MSMTEGDPTPRVPAQDAADMADSIAVLAESDLDKSERKKALGRLAGALRVRGVSETMKPRTVLKWIAEAVTDVIPHLPIRDRDTLREHFPGLSDAQIADRV